MPEDLQSLLSKYNFSKQQCDDIRSVFNTLKRSEVLQTELMSSLYVDQVHLSELESVPKPISLDNFDETETQIDIRTAVKNQENREPFVPPKICMYMNKIGRYEDLGMIAMGGMGEVRRVRDLELNRTLAMKIIHKKYINNSEFIARFVEEAQVISQLQHPNIIPVYELKVLEDGRFYYTMKEVRGETLSQVIRNVHASYNSSIGTEAYEWNLYRLIDCFHKICTAMAYAHEKGVIHRDLKPSNIMVSAFGQALIMDWGLAKILDQKRGKPVEEIIQTDRSISGRYQTLNGLVAGTPSYMPLEQAQGRNDDIDQRSDIYSLGAILYEILVGRPPYVGASSKNIFEQVLNGPPTPLQDRLDALQRIRTGVVLAHNQLNLNDLILICEKSMQRKQEERYPSATLFANDIQRWLEGAQRRANALDVIQKAEEFHQEAKKYFNQAERIWHQVAELLDKEGIESPHAWNKWEEFRSLRQLAEQMKQEEKKQYQGALFYEPTLVEAHELLAQFQYRLIQDCKAKGERNLEAQAKQQLELHVKHLSPQVAEQYRSLNPQSLDFIDELRFCRGGFVGRGTEIASIISQLNDGLPLISLVGTAGVGKTALALEVAAKMKSKTTVYFCDLTEANTILEVIHLIAVVMNLKLVTKNPLSSLTDWISNHGKVLLILDNVEQATEVIKELLQEWTQLGELQILMTSRVRLGLEREMVSFIQPLHPLEAIELFIQRGQHSNPSFEINITNWQYMIRLLPQLDFLPLAIELAAARLGSLSIEEIFNRIHERFSLLRGRLRDKEQRALQSALDWSWDLLSPWSQSALAQISIFHGGFDLAAAEKVVDISDWDDAPSTLDILEALCDDSLLYHNQGRDGAFRYALLESIRFYARDKLAALQRGKPRLEQTSQRHSAYYAALGQQMLQKATQTRNPAQLWSELIKELDNLTAGSRKGQGKEAALCCVTAIRILKMRGPISLGVLLAEERLQDPELSSVLRTRLMLQKSACLRITGRIDESREICADALKYFDQEGTKSSIYRAHGLLEMGKIEYALSNYDQAMNNFQAARENYQQLGDKSGIAQTTHSMGGVHYDQGHYQASLDCHKQALAINQEIGDRIAEASCLGGLGISHIEQGQYDKALYHYEKALAINQEIGNRKEESVIYRYLAIIYMARSEHKEALACNHQSLVINREIEEPESEAIILGNMASIYQNQGDYEQALDYYQQSLELNQRIKNRKSVAINLGNMGNVYLNQGDYEQALEYYKKALVINQEIGNQKSAAINLGNMGNTHKEQGQYDKALSFYQQALVIDRKIGNRRSEAINLGNMGGLLIEMNRLDEAKGSLSQAIALCYEVFPVAVGVFQGSLALVLAREGELEKANYLIEEGQKQIINLPLELGKFLCKKAMVQLISAKSTEAEAALHQAMEIAKSLDVKPNSELSRVIIKVEQMLKSKHN